MNSSQKPMARPVEHESHVLLVREGGVAYESSDTRDPFESLLALMEVVEALCPRWPPRTGSLHVATFRL